MQDFRMETFLMVCKYMNYTRAAGALNLTQPAVSQHIRFLEQCYGIPLFFQTGKRMHLTEAGKILRRAALTMKNDELHMIEKMQAAANENSSYSFGATLSVAEFMLRDRLKSLLLAHPQSRIRMQVADTRVLLGKLDAGEIDFAIVEGEFPRDEYAYLLFSTEEYVAVGSPKIAELYCGAPLEALLKERLFLREAGSGTREILENFLLNQGLSTAHFKYVTELGGIGIIKQMLLEDLGVSFMYRAAIRQEEAQGQLVPIALKDFSLTHEIMFIFRKNSIFQEEYERIFEELCHFNCEG